MKKGLILTSVVAGVLSSVAAFAQVDTYNFTADPSLAGTTGKYNVILEKWDGNPGGPGTQFRVGLVRAAMAPDKPNDKVASIALTFFGQLNAPGGIGTIALTTVDGIVGNSGISLLAGIPTDPVASQHWVNTNKKYNGTTILQNQAYFDTTDSNRYVSGGATNEFLQSTTPEGRINLKYRAFSVKVTLMNAAGTRVWSGVQNISTFAAPEGSSLALLATGLVPLGFVARRRARKRA